MFRKSSILRPKFYANKCFYYEEKFIKSSFFLGFCRLVAH